MSSWKKSNRNLSLLIGGYFCNGLLGFGAKSAGYFVRSVCNALVYLA